MKPELVRTTDQNKLMWQMLSDWAAQEKRHTLAGQRLDAHDFKELLMAAFQRETRITPTLDGKGVVFLSRSTSRLSKEQMAQFLTFIEAEGLTRGVVFRHVAPDRPLEAPITVKLKMSRNEIMAKARAARGNKKAAGKPTNGGASDSLTNAERTSRLPSTADGYTAYAQQEIASNKGRVSKTIMENWFLSQEQARLRQDCKVSDLTTRLLHSLIREQAA